MRRRVASASVGRERGEVVYADVGARLREARGIRGKTQAEIATLLGVDQATVARYESGTFRISLPAIQMMADHLGMPVNFFLGAGAAEAGKLDRVATELAVLTQVARQLISKLELLAKTVEETKSTGRLLPEDSPSVTERDRLHIEHVLEELSTGHKPQRVQFSSERPPAERDAPEAKVSVPYRVVRWDDLIVLQPSLLGGRRHKKLAEQFRAATGLRDGDWVVRLRCGDAVSQEAGLMEGDVLLFRWEPHPRAGVDWVLLNDRATKRQWVERCADRPDAAYSRTDIGTARPYVPDNDSDDESARLRIEYAKPEYRGRLFVVVRGQGKKSDH
jgi:transcriptional regulator with XRE-family HTH domain